MGSGLYQNRYIFLLGGVKYNITYKLDNSVVDTNSINFDLKPLKYNSITNIENRFRSLESNASHYN